MVQKQNYCGKDKEDDRHLYIYITGESIDFPLARGIYQAVTIRAT
ncbi:MAG: hypothetical protein WKF36_06700 [Candidatus Nitrosocosmicus sp.]